MNTLTNVNKTNKLQKFIAISIITVSVGSLFSGCSLPVGKSNNTSPAQTTASNNTVTNNTSNNAEKNAVTNSPQPTNTSDADKPEQTNAQNATTAQNHESSTKSAINDKSTVYYVKGSKIYHLNKKDSVLSKYKNVLSTTLKQAKTLGMHQSTAK